MVLNRIAKSVVESVRGVHPDYVLTYQGNAVTKINNTSWKRVRKKVELSGVRVHDLKHTFGRRLRAAGVPLEIRRKVLWVVVSRYPRHTVLDRAEVLTATVSYGVHSVNGLCQYSKSVELLQQ